MRHRIGWVFIWSTLALWLGQITGCESQAKRDHQELDQVIEQYVQATHRRSPVVTQQPEQEPQIDPELEAKAEAWARNWKPPVDEPAATKTNEIKPAAVVSETTPKPMAEAPTPPTTISPAVSETTTTSTTASTHAHATTPVVASSTVSVAPATPPTAPAVSVAPPTTIPPAAVPTTAAPATTSPPATTASPAVNTAAEQATIVEDRSTPVTTPATATVITTAEAATTQPATTQAATTAAEAKPANSMDRSRWAKIVVEPHPGTVKHWPAYFQPLPINTKESLLGDNPNASTEEQIQAVYQQSSTDPANPQNLLGTAAAPVKFGVDVLAAPVRAVIEPPFVPQTTPATQKD